MKYYAGMDVSLEETAICIVDETGPMTVDGRNSARSSLTQETPIREGSQSKSLRR